MLLMIYLVMASKFSSGVSFFVKMVFGTSLMQLYVNFEKPLLDGQLYMTDSLVRPERCPSKEILLYMPAK